MSVALVTERGVGPELAGLGWWGRRHALRLTKRVALSAARCALALEGWENAEVVVSCVRQGTIRDLNLTWRGLGRSTDVLSFPQWSRDVLDAGRAVGPDGKVLLGDVVVCPLVVARRAGGPEGYRPALARVVAHGVLHLLGWDHVSRGERRRMRDREEEFLARWEEGCHG